MKIPRTAVIARTKLTGYLLVPRQRNDKSAFLARAGFTQANPELLEDALRRHIDADEAVSDREDDYGRFYRVDGTLMRPQGSLRVVTVWLATLDGEFRFIALKPARTDR